MKIFQTLLVATLINAAAFAQERTAEPSRTTSLWHVVTQAVQDNPTLTLLGLLLAAFSAGFGVRKLFEDRELGKLRVSLSDLQAKREAASEESDSAASRREAEKTLAAALAANLSISQLREALSEHLDAWPADQHDQILVGIARQLLLSPGHAWLPTPNSMVFLGVEFNPEHQESKVTIKADFQANLIREIRELVPDDEKLKAALLHLAIYGFVRITSVTSPDEKKVVVVRHDHDMSWSTVRSTYARARGSRRPESSG